MGMVGGLFHIREGWSRERIGYLEVLSLIKHKFAYIFVDISSHYNDFPYHHLTA